MNRTRKAATVMATAVLCSVTLAACGTTKSPQYQGGGSGGDQTTTTAPGGTAPSSGIGIIDSPSWVAAQYVAIAWSVDPTWPNLNHAYILERPFLTPAMNSYNSAQAARPLPSPILTKWHSEVRFKVGSYAQVTSSWVVSTAGVTPSTCAAQVEFLLGTTQNGVRQGTTGSAIVYAFRMQKIDNRWYVASEPQQPE